MGAKAFRWNEWNLEHATKHGCTVAEIESVVGGAGHGFPRKAGNEKWMVIGRGLGGRLVRVFYLCDPHPFIYVINAMPVTTRRRRG
jgi:uncharacterized DUF497 family protein